ncbi:MAG: HEAT repeat domain-containing protein [Acidobacteriia bacterium]|nr:HEAT repeat domain-containing protein [Terriglobia bacterium]
MKFLWLLLLPAVLGADSAPKVSSIDYYGLRKIPANRIQKIVGVSAGDPLPPSKGDLEDRLEKIPGVVLARVQVVCCEGGGGMLFVGIEEKSAPHLALRSAPAGAATLPAAIVESYRELVQAVEAAARRGSTAEDLTQGHPLAADPDARAIEQNFVDFTAHHLAQIREVLRNSADEEQRSMAATLIGYAPDKKAVVNDLEYAMQDPDEDVRASAVRALEAIAILAMKKPELDIQISPTWLVEMLNSIVLSDRTEATRALLDLTDSRPEATLAALRERALPSLVEMAQWNSLRHALPAFILLGRVGGIDEQQIQERWARGDRGALVLQVAGSAKKKRR